VPFYTSSYGYAVAIDGMSIGRMEFLGSHDGTVCDLGPEPQCPLANAQTEVQLCVKAASLTYDVYAGSPAETLDGYTADTGRTALPPKSEFGLIKWRDAVSGPSEVVADVTTLQRLKIPIESVLLDNPWERASCLGSLQFDPKRFPNGPEPMIRAVHARGVKLVLWISPLVQLDQGCPAPAYPTSALLGTGAFRALDLTNPAVRRTFEQKLEALVKLGVDGFKADRGDETDLEPLTLSGGAGAELHNAYPALYAASVAAVFRAAGVHDPLDMFRAAAPASRGVLSGIWAGDQPASFAGLQMAIRAAASAGVSGFPVWGSDIGGYNSVQPPETADLFVRWAQLGAVSPIFEVGGQGENAMFWRFGIRAVNLFRDAAVLHYELFPYLYELSREATATGAPVLRPLAFEYPSDPAAWQWNLELLVGPSLLALPVSVPDGTTSPQYFPAGRWIPVWGGSEVDGPLLRGVTVPLDVLPLYLQAGSAVPFDFRTPEIWSAPWGLDDLDRPGRLGWLYAPRDGTTTSHSADERLVATASANRIRLVLNGARRQLEVLVLTAETPRSATIAGHRVPMSSAAALRGAADGWGIVRTPFTGVVVKITAASGTTRVTLDF